MKILQFDVMNVDVMHVFIFIIFSYITSNLLQIYLLLSYVNLLIIKLERFSSSQKSYENKDITNLLIFYLKIYGLLGALVIRLKFRLVFIICFSPLHSVDIPKKLNITIKRFASSQTLGSLCCRGC